MSIGAMIRSGLRDRHVALALGTCVLLAILFSAIPAFAGHASTGEPLFYPCTSCHPVAPGSGRLLPNGFRGHQIVLVEHDQLGSGKSACLVCHDDPSKNPGMLKTVDGSLVSITGDVSKVCFRCHSSKYKEWKAGTHGRHEPKCTASGCHDPHSPGWIYVRAMMPFTGTGFETQLLAERHPFRPLMSPPLPPPVRTPWWLAALFTVGIAAGAGIAGFLFQGRSKR